MSKLTAEERTELVAGLRALARAEHDDVSLGAEAADALEADGIALAELEVARQEDAARLAQLHGRVAELEREVERLRDARLAGAREALRMIARRAGEIRTPHYVYASELETEAGLTDADLLARLDEPEVKP